MYTVYIYYVYINTYTYSIFRKYFHVYIYINLIDIIYKYFKCIFFLNKYMHVCVFIYT